MAAEFVDDRSVGEGCMLVSFLSRGRIEHLHRPERIFLVLHNLRNVFRQQRRHRSRPRRHSSFQTSSLSPSLTPVNPFTLFKNNKYYFKMNSKYLGTLFPSVFPSSSLQIKPKNSAQRNRALNLRGAKETVSDWSRRGDWTAGRAQRTMENADIRVTRPVARRKRAGDGMETPVKKTEALEVEADGREKRRRVALVDITQEANVRVLEQVRNGGVKRKRGMKKVSEVVIDKKKKMKELDDDCNSVGVDPVTLVCPKDASDIDTYLRSMEMKAENRPNADYIQLVQKDVTAGMRGVLVDWLVEVAEEYKLLSGTLFSTVSHIDRFLSCRCIHRSKLQLLGVSCMLAASKYEEISPPNTEEFRYITDNTYTKEEVVDMEFDVLKYLKWVMGAPTAKTFLVRFIKECHSESDESYLQFESLSSYLAELSLIDYGCIQYLPSIIAASAVFLARFTLDTNANPWSTTLHLCSKYKPSDLKDCVGMIHDLQLNKKNSQLTAIREKYKQHKFKFVSTLVPPSEIPSTYFEDAPNNNNDQSVC